MVRHFFPQGLNISIDANTNKPPQGTIPGGGISPGVDSEIFNEDGVPGPIIFDTGIETGFVLIEES